MDRKWLLVVVRSNPGGRSSAAFSGFKTVITRTLLPFVRSSALLVGCFVLGRPGKPSDCCWSGSRYNLAEWTAWSVHPGLIRVWKLVLGKNDSAVVAAMFFIRWGPGGSLVTGDDSTVLPGMTSKLRKCCLPYVCHCVACQPPTLSFLLYPTRRHRTTRVMSFSNWSRSS